MTTQRFTTDAKLAAALGVAVRSMSEWRLKYPAEAPKKKDLAEWQAFQAKYDLGFAKNKPSVPREELVRRKLAGEVRLNDLKIAKEERKMIPAAEVDDFHIFIASRFKSGLYQMVSESSPKLAGKETPEVRAGLREAADMLLLSFQQLIADWNEQQRAAAEAVAHVDDK